MNTKAVTLLSLVAYNPAWPNIARTAGRSMVGSINFGIINLAGIHLKQERFGVRVPEASGVDGFNDAAAQAEDAREQERMRAEQGLDVMMAPLEQAARMKVVRDHIQEDLLAHAGQVTLLMGAGNATDPWHVGQEVKDSFENQLKLQPRASKAVIEATAKALGITVEEVTSAVKTQHERQLRFMADNRKDILELCESLKAVGPDGHPFGTTDAEAVFDTLPAMQRLRLARTADSALFRSRAREIQRFMGGNEEAKGELGLIDGTRRQLLALVRSWLQVPQFRASVDEAVKRGSNMPKFDAEPPRGEEQEKKAA